MGLKQIRILTTVLHKSPPISNITKIRPMGAALIHVDRRMDGRTDRHDEANWCFSRLCEGPRSVLKMNAPKLQHECCMEKNYIWVITGHARHRNIRGDAMQRDRP